MTWERRFSHRAPDPESVSRFVREKWGWRDASCRLRKRGASDVYYVSAGPRRAFLKVYRRGWRSLAELQGEADLIEFLAARGVRVASPFRSRAGACVESLAAPEGTRLAILFADAEGAMPAFTPQNCRSYGRVAGTMHRLTDRLPPGIRRPRLDLDGLALQPLARARAHLVQRPSDLAFLKRTAASLARAIAALLPESPPEFGMCHGDLTFGNVRRDRRGRLTLVDFELSGYCWRAYDLAVFLLTRGFGSSRRANASRMRQWHAFLDGYQAERSLNGAELQAVDCFVPLRLIWQLGQPGYDAAHFDRQLVFMRRWLEARAPF